MKKIISLLIIILCTACSSFAIEFKDVPKDYWAYNEINELTDLDIISGQSANRFNPKKYVTRSEYAAMVIKAIGQEDLVVNGIYSFEDLPKTHWSWPYVMRAVDLDILKASEGYIFPNELVTRSEIITFLVNILKTEDITKKDAIIALQNSFLDFDDVPDWFKVMAGKAEVIDVIAKEPPREQYLDYDKYITRAQMAVFLHKFKRELASYEEEQRAIELTPKTGEGIIIENVIRVDDVVTIPRYTMLPITIIGQLNAEEIEVGKMFQARFVNNIVNDDHHILLSKDTILIGKVLNTVKSKNFIRNGGILFELSATNRNGNYTRMLAIAEYDAKPVEAGKLRKVANKIIKGRDFIIKDGEILYIRLYKPMRVNIVTGEILD